jgi:hypothetical protein
MMLNLLPLITRFLPFMGIGLIAAWGMYNAISVSTLRESLEKARFQIDAANALAESNAAAVTAIRAATDRAMAALSQRAADQEKLAASLEKSLKEVRDAPKTYSCGPSVSRALDGLRNK